jgi:hypothetical protein
VQTAASGLVHSAHRPDSAKGLFDPFSGTLTGGIARVPGRPFVDGGTTTADVLPDTRRNIERPQFFDEVGSVVTTLIT